MIGLGSNLAPSAVHKAAPVVAKQLLTIGSQGVTAIGTGTLVGVGGGLILIGGDQVIRYGVENGINSITQTDHKWPPFQMQNPADVWIHGSKK